MKTESKQLEISKVHQQVLTLNGDPAIQLRTCNGRVQGSMFLQENMLLFVVDGNFNVRYGTSEYNIGKNKMAFLKKNKLFEYYTGETQHDAVANNEYILVTLRYELVKEFIKLAELPVTSIVDTSVATVRTTSKRLLNYIDSIKPYFNEEKVGGSLIKIKLLELLFHIAGSDKSILEQVLDLREHFRCNITTVVEDNIMNSLSLNQLAILSGRSLSSFRRDFLAIYNTAPSKWIRQKRLEKARELLESTNMTITDICFTLGFENIAHFSRLFKSHFTSSPSEYRLGVAVV